MKKACQICEDELGNFSCKVCGKIVGHKCYDKASESCINCRGRKEIGKLY